MADFTTDGSQADVNAKIALASTGDRVIVPDGSFTWGAGGTNVAVNKAITLMGSGATTIVLATNGPSYANGVIHVSAAGRVTALTITGVSSGHVTAFQCDTTNGWIVDNITYAGGTDEAYFMYAAAWGVLHSSTIGRNSASSELIFSRGPTDSWQTAHSMGTANNVYIEDCTFNLGGYVCDFNSNARGVVRRCTIVFDQKIDGHGKYSNTPPRGVRHMECYDNEWQYVGNYTAVELRGGSGMFLNNTTAGATGSNILLHEYYVAQGGLGPADYPIDDQIGVGIDPKAGGSEPYYIFGNRRPSSALWSVPEPVASNAVDLDGVINTDRDFFQEHAATFDGTSGVGIGTRAQMDAITPTLTGVGFWVTDEASWDTTLPAGESGQLYVWNGSAWALYYTPYTYPHPLRGGGGDTTAPTPNPNRS